MATDWSTKRTDVLRVTLASLIQNMDTAKNARERKQRGTTINAITKVLKSRGEL